ncbi:flagellar export chaperone FlgN [Rheinheimera sp. 1928-s]|uniref:flagellar export chaperone FlgN n=1 Tax=Rheinheimera sp. 1928-s TaxID=3033803 RepID=UPI002620A9D2|nr:flagellar export chaperone FlgN [Rheinheimera sp. 1928-s]MDF3125866.1 flagellar export chaperone FlgN [Rheinheimera sp. 1928-s]
MSTANSSILTLLNEQEQHLDVLFLLLQRELDAIRTRDVEALKSNTEEKIQLLELVQTADQQLAVLPELAEAKEQSWFQEHLQRLEEKLAQCKFQNQVNSQSVEQSQLVIERFKTELLQSRGRAGLTYTNKGKAAQVDKGPGIKA